MRAKHTVKAISDFAVTIGLLAALVLYGLGMQWVFMNYPALAWVYLLCAIPASFIVWAAIRIGSDSENPRH